MDPHTVNGEGLPFPPSCDYRADCAVYQRHSNHFKRSLCHSSMFKKCIIYQSKKNMDERLNRTERADPRARQF